MCRPPPLGCRCSAVLGCAGSSGGGGPGSAPGYGTFTPSCSISAAANAARVTASAPSLAAHQRRASWALWTGQRPSLPLRPSCQPSQVPSGSAWLKAWHPGHQASIPALEPHLRHALSSPCSASWPQRRPQSSQAQSSSGWGAGVGHLHLASHTFVGTGEIARPPGPTGVRPVRRMAADTCCALAPRTPAGRTYCSKTVLGAAGAKSRTALLFPASLSGVWSASASISTCCAACRRPRLWQRQHKPLRATSPGSAPRARPSVHFGPVHSVASPGVASLAGK